MKSYTSFITFVSEKFKEHLSPDQNYTTHAFLVEPNGDISLEISTFNVSRDFLSIFNCVVLIHDDVYTVTYDSSSHKLVFSQV